MRKKMKLFIAMVSVGVLLGTIPVMAAEQPELPTNIVVQLSRQKSKLFIMN